MLPRENGSKTIYTTVQSVFCQVETGIDELLEERKLSVLDCDFQKSMLRTTVPPNIASAYSAAKSLRISRNGSPEAEIRPTSRVRMARTPASR
jgi:hypothetical protein